MCGHLPFKKGIKKKERLLKEQCYVYWKSFELRNKNFNARMEETPPSHLNNFLVF